MDAFNIYIKNLSGAAEVLTRVVRRAQARPRAVRGAIGVPDGDAGGCSASNSGSEGP